MKHLLFGLASLLMAGSPLLASGEASPVQGPYWKSGWGQRGSPTPALFSWRVDDVKSGQMNWAFLIPSNNNSVTADGYSYWSPGWINCKEGTYEALLIYDGKDTNIGPLNKEVDTLAKDFCEIYEGWFKDSPYFK